MEGQKREKFYTEEGVDLYELCLIFRKRFNLIAGIVISAVLVTVVVSFLLPPVYKGSFVVRVPMISENLTKSIFNVQLNKQVPLINPKETVELISSLDRLIKEKQTEKLSGALGVNAGKIDSLVGVTAKVPKDVKNFVEIVVYVKSPAHISEFKDSIIGFLNENQYAKERISMRRATLLSLGDEIRNNIYEAETVKELINNQIKENKTMELGFNPLEMDREIIIFKQILRNIENEVKLLNGFEVVIEPVISDKPVRPKKALNVAVAGTLSLFLGVFMAFFVEWLNKNRRVS